MYRICKDNDKGRFVSCKGDTVYVNVLYSVQYIYKKEDTKTKSQSI